MPSRSAKPVAVVAMASALWGVPLLAHAQLVILPNYTVSQHVLARAQGQTPDSSASTAFGTVSDSKVSPVGAIGAGKGSVSGATTGFPMPVMSAVAHADLDGSTVPPNSPNTFITSAAAYNGELQYYFEILGPTPTVDYNITALGKLGVAATLTGSAFNSGLSLEIDQLDSRGRNAGAVLTEHSFAFGSNGSLTAASSDVTGSLSSGLTGGFSLNQSYTLRTNALYLVDMTVDIAAAIDGRGGAADASGYVDPLFTITPTTPNAGAYSLVFSDGIGNSPFPSGDGVPEPSIWALMMIGFGALGTVSRQRRRMPA